MKNARSVLVVLVVGLFAIPATSFGWIYWDGGGTGDSWFTPDNWDTGAIPPSNDRVFIGDGQTSTVPDIDGTGAVADRIDVGHNYYGWTGPGELIISAGDLTASTMYAGCSFNDGAVTQTGGDVTLSGELALGHESNFGEYTISGGSLDCGSHLLISDASTSSGLFHVVGSGTTSITASYQIRMRNGAGELKFTLGAAGVTSITVPRLNIDTATHTLTVDASGYTGPEADIILVNNGGSHMNFGSTFNTVDLSGGAISIAYGTVIGNALTVHVIPAGGDTNPPTPNPATFFTNPYVIGASAITMVADTGADASGPVMYYFDETSGNPGGTDSGWQTSATYTDTNLDAFTQYTYTVQMRDSLLNTGTASDPESATTPAGGVGAISVWNHRVDPATHPGALARKIMPVTWEDQNDLVLLPGYYVITLIDDDTINIPAVVGYYDYWFSGAPGSLSKPFGFEPHITPHGEFSYAINNYDDLIDEWVSRDCQVFEVSSPGGWTFDGFFSLTPGYPEGIPDVVHSYMMSELGGKFGGYSFGENDGGYLYLPMPETPPTREIGHDYLMGFNRRWSEKLQDYMVVLNNTVWGPYYADTSYVRQFGAQTPNQMHNIEVWAAIMRGASRLNGVLWFANIDSCWNQMGGSKNFDQPGGEDWGNSVSLIRRSSYVYYMYGASAILPAMTLHRSPDVISPFGEITLELRDFMRAHPYPDLGTMHVPVALVWDYYTGWLTPRGGWGAYMVWGKNSYEKGEHQIDMLFRSLFPHYEDCAMYPDERGFLTETPVGDIFDVLLSNVPRYVLNQYDVAVVIGETKIEGQLQATLQDFIDRGGSVATTAAQLTGTSDSMFGVQLAGSTSIETTVNWTAGGSVTEDNFTLHHLDLLPGATVVAETPTGDPVVVKYDTAAGGELIVFAADYGLTEWSGSISNTGWQQPLPSPYQLLDHVNDYLLPWLEQWNLVEITGPDIQYMTNVTEDSDRFIITLCNNIESTWNGSVSLKGVDIVACVDLITGTSFGSGSSVPVSVGPDDLVILEVTSVSPLVQSRSATPTPAPTAEELVLRGDLAFEKWDKFIPQGMLTMPRPTALSTQSAEPFGAVYVNSWLFDGMSPNTWAPAVKDMGLDGVEIRATQLYKDDMAAIWSKLASEGLRVGAVHAGVDMHPFSFGSIASDEDTDRLPTLDWLELTMELMQEAGITRLILYPGYKASSPDWGHSSSKTLASLQQLAVKAQSCGVTIMVETAYFQNTYRTTSNLNSLISSVGSAYVKAGMNTANVKIVEGSFSKATAKALDYTHLGNYKVAPNNQKRQNYSPLTDGAISESDFNEVLTNRQSSGKPTCIYMLAPDDPFGSLCDFLGVGVSSDFDVDCDVDIVDLAFLSIRWLDDNCSASDDCDGADLDTSDDVDLLDFSIFTQYY